MHQTLPSQLDALKAFTVPRAMSPIPSHSAIGILPNVLSNQRRLGAGVMGNLRPEGGDKKTDQSANASSHKLAEGVAWTTEE